MMVMFVCYELDYPEYGIFLPYATAAGIGILVFSTIPYFLYNPYRGTKKKVRSARTHIEDIEKLAIKEVRKNKKVREKEEKKFHRKRKKEDKQQERMMQRGERRASVRSFCHRIWETVSGAFHFKRASKDGTAATGKEQEDTEETGAASGKESTESATD